MRQASKPPLDLPQSPQKPFMMVSFLVSFVCSFKNIWPGIEVYICNLSYSEGGDRKIAVGGQHA
jgi:hypothetical protein